jgi:glycogenin glucosyltransferase
MFIKSDFLYGYTCLLPEEIHKYIDKYPACHDIAINMLVTGQTGTSPVLVNAEYLFEFENTQPNTIKQRSQCIDDLSKMFNGKNPLVFNNEIVSRASQENVHTPASWDTWATNADAIKKSNSTK